MDDLGLKKNENKWHIFARAASRLNITKFYLSLWISEIYVPIFQSENWV